MSAPYQTADDVRHNAAYWQLYEAMSRDVEGQRDLIDARARGETNDTYRQGSERPDEPSGWYSPE